MREWQFIVIADLLAISCEPEESLLYFSFSEFYGLWRNLILALR